MPKNRFNLGLTAAQADFNDYRILRPNLQAKKFKKLITSIVRSNYKFTPNILTIIKALYLSEVSLTCREFL